MLEVDWYTSACRLLPDWWLWMLLGLAGCFVFPLVLLYSSAYKWNITIYFGKKGWNCIFKGWNIYSLQTWILFLPWNFDHSLMKIFHSFFFLRKNGIDFNILDQFMHRTNSLMAICSWFCWAWNVLSFFPVGVGVCLICAWSWCFSENFLVILFVGYS